MVRSLNRNNRRPGGLQSLGALLTAVHGAIIDDAKYTFGRAIGLLVHDLADQAIKVLDPVPVCATTEDFGAPDVPDGEVGPSSLAFILVLDATWKSRGGRKRRAFPTSCLNTRLFVSAKYKILRTQGLSLPNTLLEVEDRSRLFQKQWMARENPASITPRSNGVLAEPAPDGGSADLRYQPLSENFLPDVGNREAREGQTLAMRQLTSESFYLHDETRGKAGLTEALTIWRGVPSREAITSLERPLGDKQDDFGANDITIRLRILARDRLQVLTFVLRRDNAERAWSWHQRQPSSCQLYQI